MDHAYIAEHSLIDRYRRGLLAPDEEQQFEEHFFGCPACAREIEIARSLEQGIKAMAAEDAAVAAGIFTWLARRGRGFQAAAAAAALLLAAAIPAAWLAARDSRRDQRAQQAAAEYRRQLEGERQQVAELGGRLAASETGRAAERARLADQLAQTPAAAGTGGGAAWTTPLLDTPILLLHSFRDQAGAGPPLTISAAKAARPLALAVEAADEGRYASYSVALVAAAGGRTLLQKSGLQPNALETLMLTFPPGFLAAGDYRLDVSGIPAGGGAAVSLGSHPFRVLGRR
jgi:hypothetical protein